MLPDRLSQLLTSYIDGELSARQRKTVQRLLRRSAEARAMLEQLQEDARALRDMPREKLEQDLAERVLTTIADRRLQVARRAALARRPSFPVWSGYVAAASVFLILVWGTYLYYYTVSQNTRTDPPSLVHEKLPAEPREEVIPEGGQPTAATPAPPPVPPGPDGPTAAPPVAIEEPRNSNPSKKGQGADREPSLKGQGADREPLKKDPVSETELARPSKDMEVFEVVNLKLALNLALKDLDQEQTRQMLRQELKPDDAYRVELFSLGHARAFERLEAAFRSQGIRLVIDQAARQRLLNPRLKADYVLYLENLAPEELEKILEQMGADDKKALSQKGGADQFGQVVILPLSATDHKELSRLLGVDPTKLDPPRRGPAGAGTNGSGGRKTIDEPHVRPEPEKNARPLARQALVLAYNPIRPNPQASREIKLFLEGRTPRRPGTVQILLVLRGVNG